LESVSKEAASMAKKYTQFASESQEKLDKERNRFQRAIGEMKKQVSCVKTDGGSGIGQSDGAGSIVKKHPEAFLMRDGLPMTCPVPIRSGHVMQLRDVYSQWRMLPCDNEGMFYASFICPYTGHNTSLASIEQVNLIVKIAESLRLDVSTVPLVFQYKNNGQWTNFVLTDQIAIAAMCCKLHRSRATDAIESLTVCRGAFIFSVVINQKIVDLQMQATHDSSQTCSARLLDSLPNFFSFWSFINRSESLDDTGGDVLGGKPAAAGDGSQAPEPAGGNTA